MKYRVSKSNNRVVLDEDGQFFVGFSNEKLAAEYCEFKNKQSNKWKLTFNAASFCKQMDDIIESMPLRTSRIKYP